MHSRLECLVSHRLAFGHPPKAIDFPIPFQPAALRVVVVNAELSGPERNGAPLLAFPQRRLGLLARGYVLACGNDAHGLARAVTEKLGASGNPQDFILPEIAILPLLFAAAGWQPSGYQRRDPL